jgi:hypothetical protein
LEHTAQSDLIAPVRGPERHTALAHRGDDRRLLFLGNEFLALQLLLAAENANLLVQVLHPLL